MGEGLLKEAVQQGRQIYIRIDMGKMHTQAGRTQLRVSELGWSRMLQAGHIAGRKMQRQTGGQRQNDTGNATVIAHVYHSRKCALHRAPPLVRCFEIYI
ncbi:hypothetical protein GCM10027277_19170 [Pseudoduganella ginsengisoli]